MLARLGTLPGGLRTREPARLLMGVLVMVAALLQLLAAAGAVAAVRGQQLVLRRRMFLLSALNSGAFVLRRTSRIAPSRPGALSRLLNAR